MKILLTVHQFFPKYCSGTEVLTLNMAKALKKLGHEVRIVTAEDVDKKEFEQENLLQEDVYDDLLIYRIKHNHYCHRQIIRSEYDNDENQKIMMNILRNYQPDIVHVFHCSKLSSSIVDAVKIYSIPVVFTSTDFWFICPMIQLRLPDNSLCLGPDKNSVNCLYCYINKTQSAFIKRMISILPKNLIRQIVKFISNINGLTGFLLLDNVKSLTLRNQFLLDQINKFDRIIIPTNFMKERFLALGIKDKKLYKNSFGIKACERVTKRTMKSDGIITFAFIGTINEHKGVHLLIEAARILIEKYQLYNFKIKIYGKENSFPQYMNLLLGMTKDNVKEHVEFLGTFPNEVIAEIFAGIDVLIVPSLWVENTPLVLYSAFMCNTPIFCSDTVGMTEVVKDNVNGFTFHMGDALDLTEKMCKVILNPKILGDFMGNIPKIKTIDENAKEMERLYQEVSVSKEI